MGVWGRIEDGEGVWGRTPMGGAGTPGPVQSGRAPSKFFFSKIFFFDFFIVFNYFIHILGVLGVPARPIEGRGPRDRKFVYCIFGLPIAS